MLKEFRNKYTICLVLFIIFCFITLKANDNVFNISGEFKVKILERNNCDIVQTSTHNTKIQAAIIVESQLKNSIKNKPQRYLFVGDFTTKEYNQLKEGENYYIDARYEKWNSKILGDSNQSLINCFKLLAYNPFDGFYQILNIKRVNYTER